MDGKSFGMSPGETESLGLASSRSDDQVRLFCHVLICA